MPVLRAVFDGYKDAEKLAQSDPEDYRIWGYGAWNEFRDPLAEFVGCTRDELALVRNATEANSYIANGLDMKPGDEVLMTDQEHPGGEHPWNLRAKRYGIAGKRIALPKPVPHAAAVLNLVNEAITPRTPVLFFSHITTVTGVVLPTKELCTLARSTGILSAADTANGGLHFERDGAARGGILDVARCGAALRDCVGERSADTDHGNRKLDVEDEEDSHSRRRAIQDPAINAVLLTAKGRGPLFSGVR